VDPEGSRLRNFRGLRASPQLKIQMQWGNANQLLTDRFRCPEDLAAFTVAADLSENEGYFRFGSLICYGQCFSGPPARLVTDTLPFVGQDMRINPLPVRLPFDPVQVVDNLRFERYVANSPGGVKSLPSKNVIRDMYYLARPLMPVVVRKEFQKMYFRGWDKISFPAWPVDRTVENIFEQLLCFAMKSRNIDKIPFVWFWPQGARSCTIVTHDIETSAGVDFCPQLMDLNDSFGIKSSFQIVPEERYAVPISFLEVIQNRGFEINVHDLNHDGLLFRNRAEFLHRAERINRYAEQFGAVVFRSAVLYRNIDWYAALDFSYDMSMPNVGHLDPQRGGCCTVLPFFIGNVLELPVTTTQDYSLFHILCDYSIQLWRRQISLIREKHGLISFIIHPDYIIRAAARRVYMELLAYLSELRSEGKTWIALPREVAAWWRLRSALKLVNVNGSWRIEGKGSERATIAYAVMADDKIIYELDPAAT
jgi:hypothetical protein